MEKERMTLYIAGPMRGRKFYNFPAFDKARDTLTALGHTVISPADLDRQSGFDAMKLPEDDPCTGVPEGFCLESCIRRDVNAVLASDGICFIDAGWKESLGSTAEYLLARWAKKEVFELTDEGHLENLIR